MKSTPLAAVASVGAIEASVFCGLTEAAMPTCARHGFAPANDVLGNLAVLLAALGVLGTGTGWPEVIVAAIMAGLALQGAWVVLQPVAGRTVDFGFASIAGNLLDA